MSLLTQWLAPKRVAYAHCDLPCGVYDPALARVEAVAVKGCDQKFQENVNNPEFQARALVIKEELCDRIKHVLWVLWSDYFKPPHFTKYPQLNQLFRDALKLASSAGAKGTTNSAVADQLIAKIDEISDIFWQTQPAQAIQPCTGKPVAD